MSVMGETAPSSAARLTRNRWPSEDTAYCCLLKPGTGPPAMRTGNRAAGVPVSSAWPSGDNFTEAAIILLSNDTSKISLPFLFHRGCAPPLLEIWNFPPGAGNGCTTISNRPDSFDWYAIHLPLGENWPLRSSDGVFRKGNSFLSPETGRTHKS